MPGQEVNGDDLGVSIPEPSLFLDLTTGTTGLNHENIPIQF